MIMRTIVDLPKEQLEALAQICKRHKISRAEAVRTAVARYVAEEQVEATDEAFGLWQDREEDGLAYERRLRAEWAR